MELHQTSVMNNRSENYRTEEVLDKSELSSINAKNHDRKINRSLLSDIARQKYENKSN